MIPAFLHPIQLAVKTSLPFFSERKDQANLYHILWLVPTLQALVGWAAWAILTKVSARMAVLSSSTATLLSLSGGFTVASWWWWYKIDKSTEHVKPKVGPRFAAGVMVTVGAGMVSGFASLQYQKAMTLGPAGSVTIVSHGYTALVCIFSVVFFGERLNLRKVLGIGLTVAGTCLLSDG